MSVFGPLSPRQPGYKRRWERVKKEMIVGHVGGRKGCDTIVKYAVMKASHSRNGHISVSSIFWVFVPLILCASFAYTELEGCCKWRSRSK